MKLMACLACLSVSGIAAAADDVSEWMRIIERTGPNGRGSAEAREASARLADAGISILPQLLDGLDTRNVVAANWYRTVFEQLVAAELAKPNPDLPLETLRRYVRDPMRQGHARRRVLQLIDRLEPAFRGDFTPKMLDDPEFREDAVAALIERGQRLSSEGDAKAAIEALQTAFAHARDPAQITAAADRLDGLQHPVDIISHMGFVNDWYLLGPFDAPGTSGFDRPFPPEERVDFNDSYAGKDGRTITWQRFRTDDRLGQINLIQAIAPVKEAVGYAWTELDAPRAMEGELRCGADDNLTVWLNGEEVFARRQWLNGTRLDRFTAPVTIRAGRNKLLVKICQGPQHKNPAVPNNWSVQVRLCDAGGAGLGLTSALPPRTEETD